MKRRFFLFVLPFLCIVSTRALDTYTRLTNLPHVYINTFGNVSVSSKSTYVYATMHYVDEQDSVAVYDSMQIRGRGNSTWGLSKKPYRIKFHNKEKFLGKGYAKARSWTLMANAGDKTMIRNALTTEMGRFLGMKFNPAAKFVDVTLNNSYIGTYQISDQVEVRAHRVNVVEQDFPITSTSNITGGYLMEIDGFAEGNCFSTNRSGVRIRIHYPDEDEIASTQNNYIKSHVNKFEQRLFSSDFQSPTLGYRPYVDSLSLASWYIATELTANIDGMWSTYFYKEQDDDHLFFGPLWDYDIAYNNDNRIPGTQNLLMVESGYGDGKYWVNQMWKDPWFTRLIYNRWKEAREAGLEQYLSDKIDSLTWLLDASQEQNYRRWGISTRSYHENVLYSSYSQYVSDLRKFIPAHAKYLEQRFKERYVPEDDQETDPTPTPGFAPDKVYYQIANVGTGSLMDVSGGLACGWQSTDNRNTQLWQLITLSDGTFAILNQSDSLALNDPTIGECTATTNVGTQIDAVHLDTMSLRQHWYITEASAKDKYNLTNAFTDHTINLNGGNAANGTALLSYTHDERNLQSNNRQWYLRATTITLPEPEVIPEPDPEPDAINSLSGCMLDYVVAYNSMTQQIHFAAEQVERLPLVATVYDMNGHRMGSFSGAESLSTHSWAKGVYVVSWMEGNVRRSIRFLKN